MLMRDAPSDEHSGDAAGGRPGGEPGVDVGLCRLRQWRVTGVEPVGEVDRGGDLLLGVGDRPVLQGLALGAGAEFAQVMPGGESGDDLLRLVNWCGGELLFEPAGEAVEVAVVGCEDSAADEQVPEMACGAFGGVVGEGVVTDGQAVLREPVQELANVGVA